MKGKRKAPKDNEWLWSEEGRELFRTDVYKWYRDTQIARERRTQVKRRRVMFTMMRRYDAEHNKSLVRGLEMAVDAVVQGGTGHNIQFWNDVQLYGIREAYAYLEAAGLPPDPKGNLEKLLAERLLAPLPEDGPNSQREAARSLGLLGDDDEE